MALKIDTCVLDAILAKRGTKEHAIIAILQDVQEQYRYLPQEVFPYLSEKLNVSEAKLYGVATFYENFSLEAKGKYVIKVCDGTACHVRKSTPILERMRKELGLTASKKTTDDLLFTVETVSCLGACGLAPVVMINETTHAAMTPDKAMEVINALKEKEAQEA